jgi:class 3 adenylate cyclase
LLELRWSIVCPSCRTQAEAVPALEDVPAEGHCQMCDIAFELDLDRAVEAVFVPSPGVRHVPAQMFCIAGPARTPHVLSQVNVAAHEHGSLEAPTKPGRYRVFARGGARASLDVAAEGPAKATLSFDDDKLEPATVSLRPGGMLDLASGSDECRHVKLERIEYASAAATAHELSTVPESRAAMLFTDLTGSTALYSSVGDAAAFRLVDDHFDVLRKAIAETGGVVVKTMGDAVMAAWPDDGAALRGALACIDQFEAFRKAAPNGDQTHLKLGLFCGPSYVVTANGALDYFGQTVNVASRLQHLAESGELVLEKKMLSLLGAAEKDRVTVSDAFDARVKGVDHTIELVRLTRKA